MKISYNWLKDIIDINQPLEEISALLTGCGLEVEGVEKYESIKGGLNGIVIGEVKSCAKHPNADKLSVTTVDIGKPELLHIVCGAPNVAAGQKVLVATVGAMIHPTKGDSFEIKKSKIRGEVSEGMLCAEDELGLGESHDGILVMPENYEVGKPAITYFDVYEDYLIEIGLTANRGDAASHLGVARDLKALTGCQIKPIQSSINGSNNSLTIKVDIEDHEGCLRYSGLSITGIEVKESPDWIKNKLRVIGINPINNIVDATNFVLHELGQPLHAFDADKIAGNSIIVKKVKAQTKFTTLDKTERTLLGTECMICDAEKPLAIAGVFGGLDSGINANTKNIFIESAYFDAASIRKTAKTHGLSTDASFRYERGTDPNITIIALGRVANLIQEIAGGTISSDIVDMYPTPIKNTEINFSIPKFTRLIGQEIETTEIKRILAGLDIELLSEKDNVYLLSVPPFRVDIKREADIAEEVLRIYGLNKIEIPTQLKSVLTRSSDENAYLLRNKLSEFLSNSGYHEMVCNSLTKSAYYTEEELSKAVKLLNPLSSDLDIMRQTLMYNGLETIQFNSNRKAKDLKVYEFGNTYQMLEGKTVETPHFAIFLTGKKQQENWNEAQSDISYFALKTAVDQFLKKAGLQSFQFDYIEDSDKLFQHTSIKIKNQIIGYFGIIKSTILKPFDIEQPVLFADILWNEVIAAVAKQKFTMQPISNFPSVRRDLALLLDQSVRYADLEKSAYKSEPKLLKQINAFDVYVGDKIEKGKKSYALSFMLQDETKTLTDQEIDGVMNKLIKNFEKEFNATLRM